MYCQGVEILKDMGFPEDDVIKALKATGNNQRDAVSFDKFAQYLHSLANLQL